MNTQKRFKGLKNIQFAICHNASRIMPYYSENYGILLRELWHNSPSNMKRLNVIIIIL